MKKLLTRTLAMVMTLVMLLSMAVFTTSAEEILPSEDFAEVDGVFHIKNASDMLAFMGLAEFYEWYAGKTVSLDANVDMTGIDWTMIGSFRGTFDGNGYAIKGVKIHANSDYVGLFNKLVNATFKDVRFIDLDISSNNSASGIGVSFAGTCTFENVYVSGKIACSNTRAGGFVSYGEVAGKVVFTNCVSACTVSGQRASGFVAQLNYDGSSAEFTDCAFIGDSTGAGKYSGAFVALAVGNIKMTRCVSIGKESTNTETTTAAFMYIDNQNKITATSTPATVELVDCYAAINERPAIGTHSTRSWGFNVTIKYGTATVYSKESSSTATLASDATTIAERVKYLAKGDTVTTTKDNFATTCSYLTDWEATNDIVAYAEGKTVVMVLPKDMYAFINASTDVPTDNGQTPEGGDQTPSGGDSQTSGTSNNTETEAAETTDTEAATTAAQTEATKEKGCGGVIGVGAVAVMAVAGAAVVATRKKED